MSGSYRLFRYQDAEALVRGLVWEAERRLHVLFVSRTSDAHAKRALWRGIVRWAARRGADVVWAVSNDETMLRLRAMWGLPASRVPIRLAAFSADRARMEAMLGTGVHLQAIDSDVDLMYVPDPGADFEW